MKKIKTQLRLRGGRITFFKYTKGSHKKKGNVLTSVVALNLEREAMASKASGAKQKRLEGKIQLSSDKHSQTMMQTL